MIFTREGIAQGCQWVRVVI